VKIKLAVVALSLAVLGGCADSSHQDAPSGTKNSGPADIINMPAGYRNVAHKCDGPNMVYVTSAGQDDVRASGVFVLANDPRCQGLPK
jgi:hypothetical protein